MTFLRNILGLAAVGIAVLILPGGSLQSGGKKENRVFELRTYYAAPGKMAALNARFREHTNKLFQKHGMELIGYWTPNDPKGAEEKLIYILAFPSKEAAAKSWKAFAQDPDWQKVRTETESGGRLVLKVDSVYLNPTDYSPIK